MKILSLVSEQRGVERDTRNFRKQMRYCLVGRVVPVSALYDALVRMYSRVSLIADD